MPAFIETQFPIARLSADSYKERNPNKRQGFVPSKRVLEGQPAFVYVGQTRQVFDLASKILLKVARQLPNDWHQRYGYRPVMLQTFV